ncbi:type VI secretion system tip protein VgrG, partial [Pseudomonas alcaligenes]|nr:type VI secretion system tip protein VgrG [Pseudomonas alcaligenes]
LKAEEHRTTHKDRKTEIRANDHLTVATNQHVKLGTGQFVEAGNEIHLSSGLKVVLEAGAELTFKAAGSFIKLDASGVTLVGPQIKINSGGGPGSGTGATPILPGKALKADSDKAGALLTAAPLNRLVPGLSPLCGKQSNGACSRGDCPCMKA